MDLPQYLCSLFRINLAIATRRLRILFARCALPLLLICTGPIASSSDGHDLNQAEQNNLQTWLTRHPQFRVAADADCDCADELQRMRAGYGGKWAPAPDYHPYVIAGDFNGDHIRDFAVVVVDGSKASSNFALLVFNGPFGGRPHSPAFIK